MLPAGGFSSNPTTYGRHEKSPPTSNMHSGSTSVVLCTRNDAATWMKNMRMAFGLTMDLLIGWWRCEISEYLQVRNVSG